jgi:hypothetical protein
MAKPTIARQQDTVDTERRLCAVLGYALIELQKTNPDRFEAIAETIFDDVPEARAWNGHALLRELLIVKGGKKDKGAA